MKLPAFYLLDAISKNVYEPYARHFAAFVIPLFLETYELVDQNTRSKMEEMLLTWRTGSPTGKELFGVPPQVAIERGVWGDGGSNHDVCTLNMKIGFNHLVFLPLQASSSFYSGSGQIKKSQVLSELEFTLGQKERTLQTNPYDTVSQNHVNVLHQVRERLCHHSIPFSSRFFLSYANWSKMASHKKSFNRFSANYALWCEAQLPLPHLHPHLQAHHPGHPRIQINLLSLPLQRNPIQTSHRPISSNHMTMSR
jgi:hypothetical protein